MDDRGDAVIFPRARISFDNVLKLAVLYIHDLNIYYYALYVITYIIHLYVFSVSSLNKLLDLSRRTQSQSWVICVLDALGVFWMRWGCL